MSANERTIRVGLIGYGYAGRTLHAPLIQAVPGLVLSVVGSSRPDVVHIDLPGVIVCAAEQVCTHPEIDLVVIATPNESHYPLARAALEAGKDVIVDKPFTVTLAEARTLCELAKRLGRLLSVFHNKRWESEVHGAKAALESGALGRVVQFECHMDRFRPLVRKRWREDPGAGSGLWFDLGPHLIDVSLYLFGLPKSVHASFAVLRSGGETDDWAHVILNYDGLRVVLQSSLLVAAGGPRTMIHGTQASWLKYGADTQEDQLKAGMKPGNPAYGIDADPGILVNGATGCRTELFCPRGDQQFYYQSVYDAIVNNGKPAVSALQASAVMAVLEASFESGRRGLTIALTFQPQEIEAYE